MLESKLVRSSYVTLESGAKIPDIMGELKDVKLSDDEDEPRKKRKQHRSTAVMDG